MKILVASTTFTREIQNALLLAGVESHKIVNCETVQDLLENIKKGQFKAVIAEYMIDDANIWELAKLVNAHILETIAPPIFLLRDSIEVDIHTIRAKENRFELISLIALEKSFNTITDTQKRERILIVEDDRDAAETAVDCLQKDYEIDLAYDGQDGFDCWLKNRHDLIILDLMLPKLNGDEVLLKIMAIDKYQPVIIVTGYEGDDIYKELLLGGASDYIAKPFSVSLIRAKCKDVLNRAKINRLAKDSNKTLEALNELMWLLEMAINRKEAEKISNYITSMKKLLPDNLSDDRKITLLRRE